jgi:exodeoxyribonuclease III
LRQDQTVRITTWNVNSIRTRIDTVAKWTSRNTPDVLLLQETKCTDADFPSSSLESLGYEVAHWGRDHWNGVAIVSRVGLDAVERGFPGVNQPPFDEARLLSATCAGVRVQSLYVPNGRELDDPHYLFKLVWLERLRTTVDGSVPTVMGGDFNVAPADLDIYDPKRWRRRTHASPPERAGIQALLDCGLRDVTREHLPGPNLYTWWGYRPGMYESNRGLRLDLLLCDDRVADSAQRVYIDRDERGGERPSDHAPVTIDFDLAE